MTLRSLRVTLFVLTAVVAAAEARAQFQTPNLSFHNSTAFPLIGKHLTVPCERCHMNGQFQGTPRNCYDCHWVRRKDDPYQTRLGTRCQECHTSVAWAPARWDHTAQAGVMLNMDHRQLGCAQCHQSTNFGAGTATCIACHQKDYQSTTSPNHAAAGFPVTCDACHSPGDASWNNLGGHGFNHASFFPLVGVHATLACVACHKNNVYRGTPRDCFSCHRAQYTSTQNPNHAAAGFPTTCDTCHRATDPAWTSATFNHNAFFPLVGVHASQPCAACHKNNVYAGTPRTCFGCHQADYNSAQNPNHIAAGFPTSCDTCHQPTDASWMQARFAHTWFPLVANHNVPCAQCHTSSNNFAAFTCTTCHDRGSTDSHHRGVNGYRYDSNACYACHPTGRGN